MSLFAKSYLHLVIESKAATQDVNILLNQHNPTCDDTKKFPETWEQVQLSWYLQGKDVYIPIFHLGIDLKRARSISINSFRDTSPLVISKIEIVDTVPLNIIIPAKFPQSPLVFKCTVPNSLAFGIDNGDPKLAQRVLNILKSEDVKVTFFPLGFPMADASNNFTFFYKDALAQGHELGIHSHTHPALTTIPDSELNNQVNLPMTTFQNLFGVTPVLFRPPYGNVDARLRLKLAESQLKTIMWSIDVKDYIYGPSSTPEMQLTSFNNDLAKGGNLVVTHFIYSSTVDYLAGMIQSAKQQGKNIMPISQCLGQ
jgi:peptidoglycan/xylan/chitin deacetylase (PgdA/CDA1 family)